MYLVRQGCSIARHFRRWVAGRVIDLDLLEKAIAPRTKALMPGYLAGAPVDMDRLYAIARAHNLRVIEGGALVLNDEDEAKLAQKYRLFGVTRSGHDGMDCDVQGGKLNLTDVAARVGLGQLPHLDRLTQQRRERVRAYFDGFEGGDALELGVGLPMHDFEYTNWPMFQITLPLERR